MLQGTIKDQLLLKNASAYIPVAALEKKASEKMMNVHFCNMVQDGEIRIKCRGANVEIPDTEANRETIRFGTLKAKAKLVQKYFKGGGPMWSLAACDANIVGDDCKCLIIKFTDLEQDGKCKIRCLSHGSIKTPDTKEIRDTVANGTPQKKADLVQKYYGSPLDSDVHFNSASLKIASES